MKTQWLTRLGLWGALALACAAGIPTPSDLCAPHFDKPVINVLSFGATGDGVTDDTQAFENALACGREVFAPKGRYRMTRTLSSLTSVTNAFFGGDGLRLRGDGPGVTEFLNDVDGPLFWIGPINRGAALFPEFLQNFIAHYQRGSVLEHFSITASEQNRILHPLRTGVEVYASYFARLEDLAIRHQATAIRGRSYANDADGSLYLRITGCHLTDNDDAGIQVENIRFATSFSTRIVDSYIARNGVGIVYEGLNLILESSILERNRARGGLLLQRNGISPVSVIVRGNRFDSNWPHHIWLQSSRTTLIGDNVFHANGDLGPQARAFVRVGDGIGTPYGVSIIGSVVSATGIANADQAPVIFRVEPGSDTVRIENTVYGNLVEGTIRVSDEGFETSVTQTGATAPSYLAYNEEAPIAYEYVPKIGTLGASLISVVTPTLHLGKPEPAFPSVGYEWGNGTSLELTVYNNGASELTVTFEVSDGGYRAPQALQIAPGQQETIDLRWIHAYGRFVAIGSGT